MYYVLQAREVTTFGEMSIQLIEHESPKALNSTGLTLMETGLSTDSIIQVFGAVNDMKGELINVGDYVRVDENRVR